MRAFAAVFSREIFERRFAIVVAIAAGFVPIIGSLAFGWRSPDAAEGRVLVALVMATALSAAFAILLGGAVIAGETREKRLSFFFSRPIPSAALWAGKLLAAIVITLATGFLAFVPGWLSGAGQARSLWGFDATPGNVALAALALAVALVLGSHAVVTVARLRSPWVALDLLLAPALVFLGATALFSLVRDSLFAGFYYSVPLKRSALWYGLPAVVGLALAAASYVQVAAGRTDARRAHGAFSVVLWGILGTAVSVLGGFAFWAASARATDLAALEGSATLAPRGSGLLAGGALRNLRGAGYFLFDAESLRSTRVRSGVATFSQDGRRAAWWDASFGILELGRTADLKVADVPSARVVGTGLTIGRFSKLALSPDGSRLAILDGNRLAAYDVTDPSRPRQLAAFQIEGEPRHAVFVSESVIRLFPRFYNAARRGDVSPAALEITELSLPSKKSTVTGRFDGETLPYLRLSADGRLFVGTRRASDDPGSAQILTLLDGRTGALVTTLTEDLRSPQLRFLTGGRIAVAGIAGARARLVFFEGEKSRGEPSRFVDLGPAKRVVLGGEIAPGRVAVALLPFEENLTASRLASKLSIVDAASGNVVFHAEGLVPADQFGWWYSSVLPPAEAGAPWTSLFLDADNGLVRLDPATGARTVLLGKGK